jgi:hypothetical protein
MTELTWRILAITLVCIVFSRASVAVPVISGLSPTSGTVGAPVTISGTNFGTIRGSVTFSGTPAVITSWTTNSTGMTSVVTTVPVGATTGNVVVTTSGGVSSTNQEIFTVLVFFAAFPQAWVDNTICNPPGGTYDATITLDGASSVNKGPNCHNGTYGNCTASTLYYTEDIAGLLDAVDNWRDNADQGSQTAHFSDAWWLIQAPNETVTTFHGSTFDGHNALISLPGKLSGTGEPNNCLVIDSTTPLTKGQMACGRGLPGFGGARNPGCSSPNDKASMWKVQIDSAPASGYVGVYLGQDLLNTSVTNDCYGMGGNGCWVNHIVMRNIEVTMAPGMSQSANNSNAFQLFEINSNPLNIIPCVGCQAVDHVGLERYYFHGWDPGDPGQPALSNITNVSGNGSDATYTASNNFIANEVIKIAGLTHSAFNCTSCTVISSGLSPTQFEVANSTTQSSVSDSGAAYAISEDSAGNCKAWDNSGTATVTNNYPSPSTILLTTGYVGMTWTVGSSVYLAGTANTPFSGTAYTITSSSPSANDAMVTSISGSSPASGTGVIYNQVNPPSQYTPGCGDDVQTAVQFQCDSCWRQDGYVEKVHWWNGESHASGQGFDNGPQKEVDNWEEGGSAAWFSGGAAVDTRGGPGSDNEIRRNYFGRDLNYRQLTGAAGNSPSPPWGCGTAGGTASHNTCPFNWAVKNSVELKLGHRNLFDGNVIENSWADGQSGWILVVSPRSCSGGDNCGVFDPSTGLPRSYIDNVRISNNWFRNGPSIASTGARSGNAGNGGGISLPVTNNDYVNNLFSNINDINQTGNPGNQWQWGQAGQDYYTCAMTRAGTKATAGCFPYQQDISGNISQIVNLGGPSVEIYDGSRLDPILCTIGSATCIENGYTVVISNHNNWNGTFAMTGTTGNWATDGTGGSNIGYSDSLNSNGGLTLCNNAGGTYPKCSDLLEPHIKITSVAPHSGGNTVYTGTVPSGSTGTGLTGATLLFSGFAQTANNGTFTVVSSTSSTLTVNNVAGVTDNTGNASSNNDVTFASLGFKMTDICLAGLYSCAKSDAVYAYNVGQIGNVSNVAGNGTLQTYTAALPANAIIAGTIVNVTGLTNTAFNCTSNTSACAVHSVLGANPITGFTISGSASLGSTPDNGVVADTSCSATGYDVGASGPAVLAQAGTITTGLTVAYTNSGSADTSSASHCIIDNAAGFPAYVTYQNNTVLSPNITAIQNGQAWQQELGNYLFNNVWADNDSSHNSDVNCNGATGEGTLSFACWDSATFEFYGNVMTGRSTSFWPTSPVDPLGLCSTGCNNSLPQSGLGGTGSGTGVNCGTVVNSGCMGYVGFTGATPTVSYPTGQCGGSFAPFNCPLMALPWTNNFIYTDVSYLSTSSYSTQGVNTTQLNNAMTQTEYVCPAGPVTPPLCGTHGPYPDN